MAAYAYQALDRDGGTQRGVLEADTARAARTLLRERGLSPVAVDSVREAAPGAPGFSYARRGLSGADLALFARELATLVDAGLPVDEALAALADQSQKTRVQSVVLALRARVREGATLADAMAGFGESFPELTRAAVAAGEQSGQLGPALLRLADYSERRAEFRQGLISALAYPVLLTGVALLIVSGLLVYVVPQVVHVFEHLGHRLPILTRALIAIAGFVQTFGLFVLVGAIALALAARSALRREAVSARWHAFLLGLPLIGRLLRAADTANATKTLAMLSGSGVPLLDALRFAARTARMAPLRRALADAALRVREGHGFARALADSGQFPPVALRLIASGEKSGRLDVMLEAAAAHEAREVETRLRTIGSVIGPLVILMVGAMVLLIVLAILLPIFQLNSLIK